jgi:hypothetical protein
MVLLDRIGKVVSGGYCSKLSRGEVHLKVDTTGIHGPPPEKDADSGVFSLAMRRDLVA